MNSPESCFALFDADEGASLLLSGWRRSLSCAAGDDLSALFGELDASRSRGEYVALVADYGLGPLLDPGVKLAAPAGRPLLQAWVFARQACLDARATAQFLAGQLGRLDESQRTAGVADVLPALTSEAYAASVERIREWIAEGDCYQINFTFPLDFTLYGHPLALYAALRERQPVRYGGFLMTPERTLLSFSPELFFERRGDRVLTRPMKGTAARGASPAEDRMRRAELLASPKERAENVMIVDLLRNDLGRLAAPGKVRVDALCAAEPYPTLWQTVSTISADLPDASLSELFTALFPCGSITGAPKIRAMQRIAELEERERGVYTGAFGWLAPGSDCRFNVAIRTIELGDTGEQGGRRARLGVGSGIVIDAEPRREYGECLLKAHFLTGFDPGFQLIETLRLENGAYPLLPLHLDRLRSSAAALGFAHDAVAAVRLLAREAEICPGGTFRVRLALRHDGEYALERTPLPPLSAGLRVRLATERLPHGDYLLRHKTTARVRYDRALGALAAEPEIFDLLFFNERGELCEGARSNVFVRKGGLLLTPPLSCGLLPGVLRRSLLDSGRVVESVLREGDLRASPEIYVGNALRGLLRVAID